MLSAKQQIVSDLYRILYTTTWACDPDNFDLNISLANGLMINQHLHFKDAGEIPDSQYWEPGGNAAGKFFDTCTPGRVPTEMQFEYLCDKFMDFELWQAARQINMACDAAYRAAQRYAGQADEPPGRMAA